MGWSSGSGEQLETGLCGHSLKGIRGKGLGGHLDSITNRVLLAQCGDYPSSPMGPP